jgi:uncharacterized protein YkwD
MTQQVGRTVAGRQVRRTADATGLLALTALVLIALVAGCSVAGPSGSAAPVAAITASARLDGTSPTMPPSSSGSTADQVSGDPEPANPKAAIPASPTASSPSGSREAATSRAAASKAAASKSAAARSSAARASASLAARASSLSKPASTLIAAQGRTATSPAVAVAAPALLLGPGTEAPAEADVVRIVNVARTTAGCAPVTANATLVQLARAHSLDMAGTAGFRHNGSDGRTPFQRMMAAGYDYSVAAENIAAGQPNAAAVMSAWMASPGHRQNILDCRFTQIGVGVVNKPGSQYVVYWTQEFGTPM